MKRIVLTAVLAMVFSIFYGQIIPENTYNHSGTYTNLANSGYKFFVMDVGLNQCRIYNTNHTLWKTINLSVPANHYLYDISFVSENLFTTDNTLCLAYIYYNYNTTGQYYTYTARIIRENGTELLNIPGCQYLYIHKLTNLGTRLVAYSFNYSTYPNYTVQTYIYNLPGQLPSGVYGNDEPEQKPSFAYPNPTTGHTIVEYELPQDAIEGELVISNMNGDIVRIINIDKHSNRVMVSTSNLPGGVYLCSIRTANGISDSGKLIVQ